MLLHHRLHQWVAVSGLLLLHRQSLLQCQRAVFHHLRRRLHTVDMHAPMRGIVHPTLYREQVDAIRAEYDVVDLLQAVYVRSDRQRDSQIALLFRAPVSVMRQFLDPVQHLHVQRMRRMRRFGQQWRVLRIHQSRPRVLANGAIDVKLMRALKRFDGVFGVAAVSAVNSEQMAMGVAVAQMIQFLLHIFRLINRRAYW